MVKEEAEFTAASLIEVSLLELNGEIRVAAWHAFVAYSKRVKNEEIIKKLGSIVPIAMKVAIIVLFCSLTDINLQLIRKVRTKSRRGRETVFFEMFAPNPKVIEPYLRTIVNYYCEVRKQCFFLSEV